MLHDMQPGWDIDRRDGHDRKGPHGGSAVKAPASLGPLTRNGLSWPSPNALGGLKSKANDH